MDDDLLLHASLAGNPPNQIAGAMSLAMIQSM